MNEHRGHPGAWILVGIVAFVIVVLALFAAFSYFSPMPIRSYGYYWWPVFPFGFVIFFVVIFLVFGVLRWAFWGWGWRRGYYGYGRMYGDPRQILKRRYARGEITEDQFDQMMRDLDQHS